MPVGSSHVLKMQKQPFPVRGGGEGEGGSKTFEDWGLKNFRTGGVIDVGGYFC